MMWWTCRVWFFRRYCWLLFVVLLLLGCREPEPVLVTVTISPTVKPLPTAQPTPGVTDLPFVPTDEPRPVTATAVPNATLSPTYTPGGWLPVVQTISAASESIPTALATVPQAAFSLIVEPLPTAQTIPSVADLSVVPADDDHLMIRSPRGEVIDGIAYITHDRHLWLIDIQNRERPFVLTHIILPTICSDLTVADNRLFLALYAPYSMLGDRIRSSGVVQFDITNPVYPVEVGFFHAPEMTKSISVVGDDLYVYETHINDPLGRKSGFHHVNSVNMMPLSFTKATFTHSWQFIQNQDWLYTLVAKRFNDPPGNATKIRIYNADTEELNEVLVASIYEEYKFTAVSALLKGETLYLLGSGSTGSFFETGLIIFDVSQPVEPVQTNYVSFKEGITREGYFAVEGDVLVVEVSDTLWLFDISHREKPKLTAAYYINSSPYIGDYIGDMGFDNGQLYLVGEDGLQFYQLDGFQLTESVFVSLPSGLLRAAE